MSMKKAEWELSWLHQTGRFTSKTRNKELKIHLALFSVDFHFLSVRSATKNGVWNYNEKLSFPSWFQMKILNFEVLAEEFPLNMYEMNEQRKQNYEYI